MRGEFRDLAAPLVSNLTKLRNLWAGEQESEEEEEEEEEGGGGVIRGGRSEGRRRQSTPPPSSAPLPKPDTSHSVELEGFGPPNIWGVT